VALLRDVATSSTRETAVGMMGAMLSIHQLSTPFSRFSILSAAGVPVSSKYSVFSIC
jgi:hypothetical protein